MNSDWIVLGFLIGGVVLGMPIGLVVAPFVIYYIDKFNFWRKGQGLVPKWPLNKDY